jgi:hypothetical protein
MTATMEASKTQTPDDIARQALRAFRRNLRHYEGIASSIAGRKIKVIPSDGSKTDGDNIYLCVPMALGKNVPHQRKLCDKRDPETMAQLCLSCRIRERVHIELMHEISHVVMGSFDVPDKVAKDVIFRLLDDVIESDKYSDLFKAKVLEILAEPNPNYWKLCGSINTYFATLLNAVEDVRVNTAMMKARRGTEPMFHALLATGLKSQKGIHHDSEEERTWRDAPLNFQMVGAIVMQASGFPPLDFCDKVTEDMTDPELSDLVGQIRETESVHEAFGLAMPILKCLHRLGYFKGPEDEDLSKEPEPEEEPDEDESDDSDDEPGEETEEDSDDQPDEDSSSGSSGSSDDESDDDGDESDEGQGDDGGDEPSDEEGSDGDGEGDSDGEDSDSSGDSSGGNAPAGPDGNQESSSPTGGDSGMPGGDPGSGAGGSINEDTPSSLESDQESDNMGTPDEVEELYRQFAGHENIAVDGKAVEESGLDSQGDPEQREVLVEDEDGEEMIGMDENPPSGEDYLKPSGNFESESGSPVELRRALAQMDFFDAPSVNVKGVIERKFDPDNMTGPWDPREGQYWEDNVYEIDVPNRLLAPALNRLRVVFTENRARQHERGLKKGKLDARSLGRKIPVGNHTIFHKRKFPQGKDHAVVIGLDISGSTASRGGETIKHIKESGYAMAELLDRLGVKFCMFAHSGTYPNGMYDVDRSDEEGWVSVDISIIKDWNDPWGAREKHALRRLGPFSANLDGHTLEYYRKRAQLVDATDKWIFYFTDGAMPAENRYEELEILQREIKVCKQLGIKLVGVGIGTDSPTQHGLDTIQMNSAEEIGVLVDGLRKRIE